MWQDDHLPRRQLEPRDLPVALQRGLSRLSRLPSELPCHRHAVAPAPRVARRGGCARRTGRGRSRCAGPSLAPQVPAEAWPVRGDEVTADGTWSVDFSEEGDVEGRGWAVDFQRGSRAEPAQWEGNFHTSNATAYPTTARLPDAPEGHPVVEQIGWLVSEGGTTGFDDGTFRPANPVTRQAMAAFLHRATTE
ncbi:MAG: S-layer homology domain-containing protein [Nitriliruptor sp.]|nr:MAG: S-layer homology domain-containing protein [Nitriliruptor sp.]